MGEVFQDGGAGQAQDAQGMEQDQEQDAQAAEAAEQGLRMGRGDGEDAARRAAVEDIGVGGAAGQQPLPAGEELFPEDLHLVRIIAAEQLPG